MRNSEPVLIVIAALIVFLMVHKIVQYRQTLRIAHALRKAFDDMAVREVSFSRGLFEDSDEIAFLVEVEGSDPSWCMIRKRHWRNRNTKPPACIKRILQAGSYYAFHHAAWRIASTSGGIEKYNYSEDPRTGEWTLRPRAK